MALRVMAVADGEGTGALRQGPHPTMGPSVAIVQRHCLSSHELSIAPARVEVACRGFAGRCVALGSLVRAKYSLLFAEKRIPPVLCIKVEGSKMLSICKLGPGK